jgi:hypothetical protein
LPSDEDEDEISLDAYEAMQERAELEMMMSSMSALEIYEAGMLAKQEDELPRDIMIALIGMSMGRFLMFYETLASMMKLESTVLFPLLAITSGKPELLQSKIVGVCDPEWVPFMSQFLEVPADAISHLMPGLNALVRLSEGEPSAWDPPKTTADEAGMVDDTEEMSPFLKLHSELSVVKALTSLIMSNSTGVYE